MNHPLGSPVMQWPVKLLDPWQFRLCQNTESTLTIFITELDPWNHDGGWKKHLADSWEVHAAIWVVCIGGHHLWCACYLLGLQLNPASGCLAPGVFCLEYATKPKEKKGGRGRERIALIFSNWVFIVVESYSSNYLLQNSLQKKKKCKMVKWRNTSYLSLLSLLPTTSLSFPFFLSPHLMHINSPCVLHVHFLSVSYLARLSLDHVSNSS